MAIQQRKMTGDEVVDEMMYRFDDAIAACWEHFERMERTQQAYGNKVNTMQWPTQSEIALPLTFVSVEEQLPIAFKYLFPQNRWLSMIPTSEMAETDVRNVEDNMRYTLLTQMDLQMAAIPSIKDNYKFGVGYGVVDTEFITPPQVVTNQIRKGGRVIDETSQIVLGRPKQVCVYKHASPAQVVPMPDGANIDGPNKASGHFYIDLMHENKFRSMYERKGPDGKPMMKGDVDDIIAEARHLGFDRRSKIVDNVAKIAGMNIADSNNGQKYMPVVIPVIRCYFENHHAWIANGTTLIWEQKSHYQTMMSDVVKWSAWPDGKEWFPIGITEASERLMWGINIWYNGLVDLAMYHMNPTRVINTRMVDDPDNVPFGPRSDVKVNGNPAQAVSHLELPQFPQQLFQMGDILQQMHGQTNGVMNSVREGAVGLVRGGMNALEGLLQSSTGRQFLAAMILKTGGLKATVEKTLIKKQMIMDRNGETFVDKDYDPVTGERKFVENAVTREDMRHVFRVELNMPAARLNSSAAFAEKSAFFDRAQKNGELFDQRSLYEELTDDFDMVRRTMLPEEVVRKRQEQAAQAKIAAAQAEAQPGAGQEAPSTQGDQALAGAAPVGSQL